jgi:hypothetical protein
MFESLTDDMPGSLANSSCLKRRRERRIKFSVLWCNISRSCRQSDTPVGFSAVQYSEKGEKEDLKSRRKFVGTGGAICELIGSLALSILRQANFLGL